MADLDYLAHLNELQPQFALADVLKITGVTKIAMQNWASRGLIVAASDPGGRHGKRLYDFARVATIDIATKLSDLGVSAKYSFNMSALAIYQAFEARDRHYHEAVAAQGDFDSERYDLRHYFSRATRAGGEGKHRLTTFSDFSMPIDDLLGSPGILINTGELLQDVAKRTYEHMQSTSEAAA